ncbi:hypothetical protein [Streptomyces carpinensis]|uniref:Lipoprotein n=1 Tax=Streptomyces carpinensis TaxID=66369 RepID=A0ABV1W3A7_9ACTN|nr:hypothetical protein [Streptomyces carpinensis]
MKNRTVRRTTLSIAVVAALTGVAACGSGSSGGKGDKAAGQGVTHVSPIAALRTAADSTAKADSAKVESTTSMGDVMTLKGAGSLAWGDGLTGSLTLTYTGGKMADAMRAAGSPSIQARYLPDAYYAKMSEKFAQQAGGGKHWVRYGYEDIAQLGGSSGAYLKDQLQNTTPNQSVKLLLASGDVKKVGEEQVGGEHTTHYHGTVDVADFADKSSKNLSASQLADLKKQLSQAGITTETVDLWINDQNLLVKKAEKGDTANGTVISTATYRDYGVKVSAEAPPAGDTVDFKNLMKAQAPAQGGTGTGTASGGSGVSS